MTQMVVGVGQTAKIAEIMGHFTHTKKIGEVFTRLAPKEKPLQLPEHVPVRLPVEMRMEELGKAEIRQQGT